MDFKSKIEDLINKFRGFSDKELKKNEANVRKDFINPFFRALGWKIESDDYEAETYVGSSGIADIAMKIDGKIVCYQEAKRFKQDCFGTQVRRKIKEPVERQVLRYCFENSIQWAVLTNFIQTRVFFVPEDLEVISIKNAEYLAKSDLIQFLSPESFRSGTIKQLVKQVKRKDIDLKFLDTLSKQRITLANSLHKSYPDMNKDNIDENVQRLLDRIVITRFAEDKGFIQYERLKRIYEDWKADKELDPLWSNLRDFWARFDMIYNSKLFSKHPIDKLGIDNKILGKIIENFYMVSFRAISPLVLGNTYELYLGYDLKLENSSFSLTKTLAAQKAGGIYYTPSFVTNYVVRNVFGNKITNILKSAQVKLKAFEFKQARQTIEQLFDIKVLDPACGSGNFLVSAYQTFKLAFEDYNKLASTQAEKKFKSPTIDPSIINPIIKKWNERILKDVIWGIDIDEIAAEITTVSIIISAMYKNQKFPLLLSETIFHGNSIIPGILKKGFSKKKVFQSKFTFNWDTLPVGKFSYIIGNPPYVCSRKEEITSEELGFFKNTYSVASYQVDLYQIFFQLYIEKAEFGGGLIIPDAWLTNIYSETLRKFLLNNCKIEEIVICPPDTFSNVVDTVIVVFSKLIQTEYSVKINKLEKKTKDSKSLHEIPIKRFKNNPNFIFDIYVSPEDQPIIEKIERDTIPLGLGDPNLAARGVGVYHRRKHSEEQIQNKTYHSKYKKDATYIPNITGKHIRWFGMAWEEESYLSYGDWLSEPRDSRLFQGPRILLRKILGKTFYATYTDANQIVEQLVYIWKPDSCSFQFDPFYVLALLNSELMSFYFRLKYNQMASFPHINVTQFRGLPIKKLQVDKMKEISDYARLLSFFIQIRIKFFKTITKKLNQIKNLSITLRKWIRINKIDHIIEDEHLQGVLRELKIFLRDPNTLELKVFYEFEKSKESSSVVLNFRGEPIILSLIYICLDSQARKFNFKKKSNDLMGQVFTILKVNFDTIDSNIIKTVKNEWENSVVDLFNKLNINSVEDYGFPHLKTKLRNKVGLWWDIFEPKDIDGVISALNTIFNRKLELYYNLTSQESDRIRKFISIFN